MIVPSNSYWKTVLYRGPLSCWSVAGSGSELGCLLLCSSFPALSDGVCTRREEPAITACCTAGGSLNPWVWNPVLRVLPSQQTGNEGEEKVLSSPGLLQRLCLPEICAMSTAYNETAEVLRQADTHLCDGTTFHSVHFHLLCNAV